MKKIITPIVSALLIFLFQGFSTNINAQITIDQTMTPEELVVDHLVGSGLGVSNVTFNGLPGTTLNNQIGLFSGTSGFVEFNEGIAFASGDIEQVTGVGFNPVDPNIVQDPDLLAIVNSGAGWYTVNNCAILEFDFVPDFPYLTVGYVFMSMEYPGFTCSQFNDAFGFFVSGPGISGPYSNGAVNIALIPDTETPVGINTVNSGSPTGGGIAQNCLNANPNYVQDSIYFTNNNPITDVDDIQFPGMTVNLYANYILTPGETYHIKLAVGDASDGALDSGVILEGASFSAFPISGMEDYEEFINGMSLKLFPNPASEYLSFNLITENPAQLDVQLIDLSGKPVLTVANNLAVQKYHLQQIDLNSVSKGVYFLQITDRVSGFTRSERIQKY
jgi:hypothetical protein